jgi:hypothetical protein
MGQPVAVVNEFPAACETLEHHQRVECHGVGAQHLVGRLGIEGDSEALGVAREARAGKQLEEIHLNLRRIAGGDHRVEAAGERGFVLSRQTEDEVGVYDGSGVAGQEAEIREGLGRIALASDGGRDLGVQRLHADLQMERVFRKGRKAFGDRSVQRARIDLEVQARVRRDAVEKEIEHRRRVVGGGVERAVEELETAQAALPEPVERRQQPVERNEPQAGARRRAVGAAVGTAAARLRIDGALREVGVGVEIVRQRERRGSSGDG